jgi:hypothetical protein
VSDTCKSSPVGRRRSSVIDGVAVSLAEQSNEDPEDSAIETENRVKIP